MRVALRTSIDNSKVLVCVIYAGPADRFAYCLWVRVSRHHVAPPLHVVHTRAARHATKQKHVKEHFIECIVDRLIG